MFLRLKRIVFYYAPLALACAVLVFSAVIFVIVLLLSAFLDFVGGAGAGGWTWIFVMPVFLLLEVIGQPWSEMLGDGLSFVNNAIGILINGVIGLIPWRLFLYFGRPS